MESGDKIQVNENQPAEAEKEVDENQPAEVEKEVDEEKSVQKKKTPVWQTIANIVSWVILGITVLVMAFTIFSSLVFNREDRKVFGVSMMIVMSDSMKATDFAAGDLIFIQEVNPETLKEGDIICFTSQNNGSVGETVTHKIKKVTKVPVKVMIDGVTETRYVNAFITYGTTTGEEDESPVTYEWIKGKYVGKIPYAGHVFNFLRTPAGYICIILIPFVLLIGYQAFNAIRAFRAYRGEQTSEFKKERSDLKKEREENLKMLEEMRALKAQLDAMKSSVATNVDTENSVESTSKEKTEAE